MHQSIKYIVITIIAAFFLVGCNDGLTMQRYFVEHQETNNFLAQDVPISMLNIDESKLTAEQREAYNSVKRLNFLGYKIDSTNVDVFNSELAKVITILNDEKYNELIDFSYEGAKIAVKYVGDDYEADEFIIFGSSKDMGFGIVRVLGEDMSPEKMMTLGQLFESSNVDTSQFKDLMTFFK
ncbi:DUF4252 domain-containing protein [Confluentibacter flavum]|uniref:DUF4252 domain-containing protein n=1 Tax=Confluentibacter flavum TaxID=1909700 RepID=A0A2N3HMZ7_9FLAO|nr:DUF4252 domain-containing protein [Confluentibacter flavum]PKQ46321.1 DUF4252 domain-containing protein [Confluentibacter flavum]